MSQQSVAALQLEQRRLINDGSLLYEPCESILKGAAEIDAESEAPPQSGFLEQIKASRHSQTSVLR